MNTLDLAILPYSNENEHILPDGQILGYSSKNNIKDYQVSAQFYRVNDKIRYEVKMGDLVNVLPDLLHHVKHVGVHDPFEEKISFEVNIRDLASALKEAKSNFIPINVITRLKNFVLKTLREAKLACRFLLNRSQVLKSMEDITK